MEGGVRFFGPIRIQGFVPRKKLALSSDTFGFRRPLWTLGPRIQACFLVLGHQEYKNKKGGTQLRIQLLAKNWIHNPGS